ncbi:MAG: fucose isomerase [Treponema sp.]|jgi:L-fucose isomerase-like protein|nr:fucose isomerase [Treponema sp.]
MQIVYVPIGVPTFDLGEAEKQFEMSKQLLFEIDSLICVPEKILLSLESIATFLARYNPDLVIIQNITFANSEYCSEVVSRTTCPVLLWTLREPDSNGGRLKLNSLTGAFSAGNVMYALGRSDFEYIIGAPDEVSLKTKIEHYVKATKVYYQLKKLSLAAIGGTPQGFGFGRALDAELRRFFGVRLISAESRELMKKAALYTTEELDCYKKEIEKSCIGTEKIPAKNFEGYLRLRKAYADFISENTIGALASRCWPDFFTEYGTPVCAVLSMLNNTGIPATGESDIYGALTMYIAWRFTGTPAFFGDPVAMNEDMNTITYWHCGMAAPKLTDKAFLGVHPNRKIGPVMDFGCKSADTATVIRIGRKPDGKFRMLIITGSIPAAPRQYSGTSVVFKPETAVGNLVYTTVKDGWEPHYIVVFSNIVQETVYLANLLHLEICRF